MADKEEMRGALVYLASSASLIALDIIWLWTEDGQRGSNVPESFPSTYVGSESTKQDIYLSVIIRTLNGAERLKQVFDALMAQRCNFNWEISCVDNGSEDETLELCREYRTRVIYLPGRPIYFGRAAQPGCQQHSRKIAILV